MVKPRLFTLFSFVWEPILRDNPGGHDLIEFGKKLPELRNALSCGVCNKLLTNRVVLSPSKCNQHFVCEACKGKSRNDNNKCEHCEDWNTFKEDEALYVLLRTYQEFCYFVLTAEHIVRLLEVKHEVDPTFKSFEIIDLVAEGVKGSALLRKRKLLPVPNEDRGVTPHNLGSLKKYKKVRDSNEAAGTAATSVSKSIMASATSAFKPTTGTQASAPKSTAASTTSIFKPTTGSPASAGKPTAASPVSLPKPTATPVSNAFKLTATTLASISKPNPTSVGTVPKPIANSPTVMSKSTTPSAALVPKSTTAASPVSVTKSASASPFNVLKLNPASIASVSKPITTSAASVPKPTPATASLPSSVSKPTPATSGSPVNVSKPSTFSPSSFSKLISTASTMVSKVTPVSTVSVSKPSATPLTGYPKQITTPTGSVSNVGVTTSVSGTKQIETSTVRVLNHSSMITSSVPKQITVPTVSVTKQSVVTKQTAFGGAFTYSSQKSATQEQVPQNKLPSLENTEKCGLQHQTTKNIGAPKLTFSTTPTSQCFSNVVTTTVPSAESNTVCKPQPQLPVSLVGKMSTVPTSSTPTPPVKVGISKVLRTPMIQKGISVRNVTPSQGLVFDRSTATGRVQLVSSAPGTVPTLKITTTTVSSPNKNVPTKPQKVNQFDVTVQEPAKKPQQQPPLSAESLARIIAVSKGLSQPSSTPSMNVFSPAMTIPSEKPIFAVSTAASSTSSFNSQLQQLPTINTVTAIRTPTTSSSAEKVTSVRIVPLPISTVEKVNSIRPQVQVSSPFFNKNLPFKPSVSPSPTRPVMETPKPQQPIVTSVTNVGAGVTMNAPKYIQIKVEPQQPQMQINKPNAPEVPVPTTSTLSNLVAKDIFTKGPMSEDAVSHPQMEQILPHSPIKPTTLTSTSSQPLSAPVVSSPINVNSLPITLTSNLLSASGQPAQIYQISQGGNLRALSIRPQQMRISANMTYQGRTLPVHIIGPPSANNDAIKQQIVQQLTAAGPKRKIVFGPPDMHAWPDHTKIIQVNASDLCRLPGFAQATIRPSAVNVGQILTSTSTTTASNFTNVNVRPVVNTGSLVRPTTTSTSVSNVTSLASNVNMMKTNTVSTQPSTSVQISRTVPSATTSVGTTIIRSDGVTTLRQVMYKEKDQD
ncbi:unnamed protein product [Orchesella dallaii]|uniref:E3 ubiquitin-protein ligase Msl2 zinc RING finger domain-containing protein n=1 Tax=Orchesella dallaii TaxID=48710 RepID=A0ABP1QL63_9HEXA